MSTTSDRIKQSRKNKGLTMDQLASEMGLKSQRTIVNWENGTVTPNETKLNELARVLNVDYLYLLGFQSKPKYTKEDEEKFLNEHVSIGEFTTDKGSLEKDNKLGEIVRTYLFSNKKGRELLQDIAEFISEHPEKYDAEIK